MSGVEFFPCLWALPGAALAFLSCEQRLIAKEDKVKVQIDPAISNRGIIAEVFRCGSTDYVGDEEFQGNYSTVHPQSSFERKCTL